MGNLTENLLFKKLTSTFHRSPLQVNHLLESDAELIQLKDEKIIAVTTDCIVEEIESGLYDNPYLIGWMSVVVNLSDLAAVGAAVLGVLLQENIPHHYGDDQLKLLQEGISDACKAHQTFILGGDTNRGKCFQVGGTAVGMIEGGKFITRKGSDIGDLLFISGKMGLGNAFAFSKLFNEEDINISYFPKAKLIQGELIRQYGSSCIDTSDGFFPAVCNLMEINKKGFELFSDLDAILCPEAAMITKTSQLPGWFFLAGPHGEYELLFSIPEKKQTAFLDAAKKMQWNPITIGKVNQENSFSFTASNQSKKIDPFEIANLFSACNDNPETYLKELFKMNEQWKKKM